MPSDVFLDLNCYVVSWFDPGYIAVLYLQGFHRLTKVNACALKVDPVAAMSSLRSSAATFRWPK